MMDSNENKSWCEAERMTREQKIYKRKKKKLDWKKVSLNIRVPICPKCNVPTSLKLHKDGTFIYNYYCKLCDFTFSQLELY